ncbi:MAG: Nif3-like dinuclear metal center hexameric protein [Clostridium sp.]|nr:Nif3-like dinuclear metal center hexameric protein [Bacteroides sp.]MCM1198308.1 Nif3-like dinuclear metal center hexameric protein [Clostridium sp.]
MARYFVRDVVKVLEEFAPLSLQEKWDNSGLCIGTMDAPVSSVLLGLDCTPELVDEAVACGADMIVTHHPLIFQGLKRISPEDSVGYAVMKAVSAGISVYAAHTSADKVIAGVSGAMARRLGLENIRILDEDGDGTGLGVIGDFPVPMSASDAINMVKERFALKAMRTSRPVDCPVSRVAMCGGSGGSLIGKAMACGAQLYLCGDVSYHQFFTPKDFMIMDIGHYESEIDIVEILFSLIRKNFPTFAVRITENIYSNPIFYF